MNEQVEIEGTTWEKGWIKTIRRWRVCTASRWSGTAVISADRDLKLELQKFALECRFMAAGET
jgi:hypothetical protein